MIKRIKTQCFSAVFAALCVIAASSCKQVEPAVIAEVSVKYSEVSSAKGSLWVSVVCSGEWQLSLKGDAQEVDWATLEVTHGTGNKSNVGLSYQANETGEPRTLEIVITCGEQWNTCMVTQLASESVTDGDDDLSDGSQEVPTVDLTMHKWLELPSMEDDELSYFSHNFQMNGNTYRNYSFGYSKKDYLAVWVAYPLRKLYTNGSSSSSKWIDNPYVDTDYEPNYANSFGYSRGYERGHQIANADRKCCYEANKQTYYFTNATLQHKDFNGPVWGVLESNMRAAANSADTLYVVTGCVLSDNPEYIQDSRGHKVPRPSAYFKAAVRYHAASTMNPWMGAAFYLDHDASKYSSKKITASETMSIAELEKKLGMNFFVNLPEKVGEAKAQAIEAQDPAAYPSVWGIN